MCKDTAVTKARSLVLRHQKPKSKDASSLFYAKRIGTSESYDAPLLSRRSLFPKAALDLQFAVRSQKVSCLMLYIIVRSIYCIYCTVQYIPVYIGRYVYTSNI